VNPYAVVAIVAAVVGYVVGWRTAVRYYRQRGDA